MSLEISFIKNYAALDLHLNVHAFTVIRHCFMFSLCFSDGKMFGFGFVQFLKIADANKALTEKNAKPILGMC